MKEDRPFPEPVRRPTAVKAGPASSPPGPAPALLDRLRERIRSRHYSPHTERAYVAWVSRYVLFHRRRDPAAMAEREVGQFLPDLAARQRVAASTQNQALSALLFLYDSVLGRPLARLAGVVRARRPKRLPRVLSREEVRRVLAHLHGASWLMASLMYGSGLRLMECAPADHGHRLRPAADRRARRQGTPGPRHAPALRPGAPAQVPPRAPRPAPPAWGLPKAWQ